MPMSFLEYAAAMHGCYRALPMEERDALHAWEATCLGGSGQFATSDWPGWQKYIGKFQPEEKRPRSRFGSVYVIQSDSGHCKIGSSNSVAARLRQLQCANPQQLKVVHHFESMDALRDERRLHREFAHKRIRSEWFYLSELDIAWIRGRYASIDVASSTSRSRASNP